MKRLLLSLSLLACLLLAACTPAAAEPPRDGTTRILCTTYPVYLFTTAVTDGVDGLTVSLLVNAQTSCLHDYTLTVKDMKAVETADVIILNGVGLEDFLDDALSRTSAAVIDCSAGLPLLSAPEHEEHHSHDHEEEYDPHIWMSPHHAAGMVENIAAGLSALDSGRAQAFAANRDEALKALASIDPASRDAAFPSYPLITFHNGFRYFAAAQGFDLLSAIEEEEGSTASARDIKEITALVHTYDIPAVFTEKSSSAATARAISRETGCQVYELDMLMSGSGSGIQPYLEAMEYDLHTILEAMQ